MRARARAYAAPMVESWTHRWRAVEPSRGTAASWRKRASKDKGGECPEDNFDCIGVDGVASARRGMGVGLDVYDDVGEHEGLHEASGEMRYSTLEGRSRRVVQLGL